MTLYNLVGRRFVVELLRVCFTMSTPQDSHLRLRELLSLVRYGVVCCALSFSEERMSSCHASVADNEALGKTEEEVNSLEANEYCRY